VKLGLQNKINNCMEAKHFLELILEIFSEELPARMQSRARTSLAETAKKEFKSAGIDFESLNTFVSARRLTLIMQISAEPKEKLDDIVKRTLERILKEFSWPKSMRWDDSSVKWVRPIRNLLCVLDGKTIPIKYGNVVANNISFGHRFLAPKSFFVSSSKDYFSGLKKGKVMLELEERKLAINDQIAKKLISLQIISDERLLEEVAGLVEYPVVLLGEIDKEFLTLPREVIISAVKNHQKYFVVEGKNGKLAPHFVMVSNITTKDGGEEILKGNQRVLRARLADAQFFFDEDRSTSLESKVESLKKIIFHERLGTLFDKVSQIEQLVEKVEELSQDNFSLNYAKRAAHLSKADLTTNLVKEFPELQGTIGSYYAELDGENKIVAEAIADHYLPKGKNEKFPVRIEGAVVAIADKVSTLTSLFAAGEIPTSSKDPYSLRRQALGIIKLLCHFKISLSAPKLVEYGLALLNATGPEILKSITDFLFNRFKFFLKDQFRPDQIEAVLVASSGDIYSDFNKLVCLSNFLDSKEGQQTFLGIKRVLNIATSKNLKNPLQINEKLFNEHEQNLYSAILKAKSEIHQTNHDATLKSFAKLAKTIDVFFDEVLVMDENPIIRANRLALLETATKLFASFADFSVIDNTQRC